MDLIVVHIPEFLNAKIDLKNDDYKDLDLLIETLFKENNCFCNEAKANSSVDKKQIKPVTHERETVSCLNKITKNNYDLILKKLLRNTDSSNIEFILMTLFAKCTDESTYLDLYIEIFLKLNNIFPEKVKTFCEKTQTEFTQIIPQELMTFQSEADPVKDYEDFCLQQKKKNKLINYHKFLLRIIKYKLLSLSGNQHLSLIFFLMDQNKENATKFDKCLQFLSDYYEIFSFDNDQKINILRLFSFATNELKSVKIKCQFLSIFDTISRKHNINFM